jgi:hypothetical protein
MEMLVLKKLNAFSGELEASPPELRVLQKESLENNHQLQFLLDF